MTRIRTWCLPAELCTSCCRLGCGMHAAPIAGVWQAGVAWHASGYARPGKRVSSERVCAHIVVYLTYGGLTLRELCCLLGCVGLRCWCTCVFLFVVQPLSASFVVAAATPVQQSLICIVCRRCSPLLVGHQRHLSSCVDIVEMAKSRDASQDLCRLCARVGPTLTQHVARCLHVPARCRVGKHNPYHASCCTVRELAATMHPNQNRKCSAVVWRVEDTLGGVACFFLDACGLG